MLIRPFTASSLALLTIVIGGCDRQPEADSRATQLRGQVVVDRVIDVHIGKLRRKIEADATKPRLILTVRGTGYRFADRGSGGNDGA